MTTTMLLDRSVWDLCKDAAGNWAVASSPYATAQDVASAIRTFAGEGWYNTALGVPYFTEILGRGTPIQVIKENFIRAAETVPGVHDAQCFISSITDRNLTGQVVFTDTGGATQAVGIG